MGILVIFVFVEYWEVLCKIGVNIWLRERFFGSLLIENCAGGGLVKRESFVRFNFSFG